MRILAIETVGIGGSVAALIDGQAECRQTLSAAARAAQTLAPALERLLAEVGWRFADVELLATAIGPGSFTGLRIGVTTAKMLAWAGGCPLVGVNTLEAIACQTLACQTLACQTGAALDLADKPAAATGSLLVALDAQRRQVFSGRFSAAGDWTPPGEVLDNAAWLAGLEPSDTVSGPALERLAEQLPPGVTLAPRQCWSPDAVAVGQVAWRAFLAGRRDDPFQLVPLYLRRTAAEEQWERLGRS